MNSKKLTVFSLTLGFPIIMSMSLYPNFSNYLTFSTKPGILEYTKNLPNNSLNTTTLINNTIEAKRKERELQLIQQKKDLIGKKNVLFIAVDDLRPELGCYGNTNVISPNIDSIAKKGIVFDNAFCQQAVCAPSRASVLTGNRPDTTTVWDLETPMRSVMPNVLSLPEHFKNNGYETLSIGKIYHHAKDDLQGWSKEPYRTSLPNNGYLDKNSIEILKKSKKENPSNPSGPAFESPDVPDNAYIDGKNAEYAVGELRRLKEEGKTFFMAMGFSKPHLPFNAPKKYWDLYDKNKIPLATNPFAPEGVTPYSLTNFGELRGYNGIPKKGMMPEDLARTLKQGYYASVSYTDAQVGKLLAELDALGMRENTIVILWGDHGWKLGEHGEWTKHTNFENDTKSTLILSVPGMKDQNKKTTQFVEFVDMYPTLAELCGLEIPKHLEGISFLPLLIDQNYDWKNAAFSQFPRQGTMGYAIRTKDFRYVEWKDKKTGAVKAKELYDHKNDPEENVNLATKDEYKNLVSELSTRLSNGWKGALPDIYKQGSK